MSALDRQIDQALEYSRRIARMAERPENQRLRPNVEKLTSEFGFTELDAWDLALDERGYNVFLRNAARRQILGAEASPSQSRSSVGKVRPGRQDAGVLTTRDATRKPGESQQAYYTRLKRQISQLGQPAGRTGETTAKGLDVSTDPVLGMHEKSESAYAENKRTLLASEPARRREINHRATSAGSPVLEESKALEDRVLGVMRERGQSTRRNSKTFAEDYANAARSIDRETLKKLEKKR